LIARKRLLLCANRFSKAARLGTLEHLDNRELNEFAFVEVFEIDGFLKQDDVQNTCLFHIQSDATAGMLACPPAVAAPEPICPALSVPSGAHG